MEEPATAAALLRVVDQARQLNGAIDVARLERMRFIYRSWVASPHGVEGGFSLTRDELDCVLEYPQQPAHLDFLMATFRTTEHDERIDLLTLLAACACLARGPLEAKAKFLFMLVDFDTEDEIVEDELAMLIALCSDGLRRLGVVVTELVDLDARAIACEAFEFVDVEDGGKMSLALFVLWLVSHWRPAALFDRIQSLFLISTISRRLHEILQQHSHDRISCPFHMYNAAHFREDSEIEAVNVIVGPIVGPVSSSEVRILLEVDRSVTVRIFVFHIDPSCRSSQRPYDQVCCVELQACSPQVVVVDKLASGQTYQFRLLGVCKRDRERCIAVATTLRTSSSAKDQETTWQMRAINHNGIGLNTDAYRRLRDESLRAAEAKTDMVTIHFSALRLGDWDLARMLELLRDESLSNETRVLTLLQQKFRDSLSRSELFDILRVGSNLIFSSCLDLVDPERSTMVTINSEMDSLRANLMRLTLQLWRSYIGKLWKFDTDDTTATIHNGDCCFLLRFDEQKVEGDGSIAQTLPTLGAVRDLVVVTRKPALCQLSTQQTSDNERVSSIDERHRVPDDVMSLADWKRVSLDRNVYLVSSHALAGFHSHLNIKNTTISLSEILCGPASGYARRDKLATRPMFVDFPESTVSTTVPTVVPHFVTVRRVIGESSSRPNTQVGSSRPTSRSTLRSSQGDVGLLSTRLVGEVSLLCGETGTRVIAGPAIGVASGTSASIVLECDQDGTVDVTLNDVLTKQAVVSRVSVHRNRQTKCIIKDLSPGRVYSASVSGAQGGAIGLVQTPCRDPASMRIVLLGGDTFCGLPARDRRGYVPTVPTSLMGSIREHLVLGARGTESIVMYDMVIHIGTIAALRHDLLRGYEMMRKNWTEVSSVTVRFEEMIRSCYRSYAAIPDVRALRSLGTNWFSGVGLLRSLVRSETPIRLLEVVRRVVHEYERCDETLERHDSQLIHKLASQVFVVKLDTTDCLFRATHLGFVEWPESILTSRQLDAIRHALNYKDPQLSSSDSKQVVIFCDAPFVWPFTVDSQTQFKVALDPVENIANDPWGSYPHDLQHLLDLLFSAVATDSMLRITLVCSGVFAARVVITHKPTGRSLEQLTVGTTSNIDREPSQTARYTPESSQRVLGDDYTVKGHAVGGTTLSLKQYCVLNVVPHSQGAVCTHFFYTAGRPQASIILGPIIGRVTTRTARILIEVDRPVPSVTCVLANPSSGHTVSANAELSAFAPTIFKVEGLHPGTRYKVKFEGIMTERDDFDTYIETPPLSPLTVEWLVFSHNNLRRFLPSTNDRSGPRPSHWHRILSSGARSYQAKPASIVANSNGDSLGESLDLQSEQYNPWYHVEGFALSEPLRQTQLSVHIGGQVDLSAAFTENELVMLVAQLCDPMQSEESKNSIYSTVRFRLQEAYRNTWGVEPMRTVLGYSSNIMLLHDETDLFFSTSRIQGAVKRHISTDEAWRVPPDNDVALVATRLRALAFELWQLYQNQLSMDVNESDLDNSRRNSSKFASQLTLGMCRLVFVNISDEMRDVCSNFEIANHEESRPKTPKTREQVVPLALPVAKEEKQLTLLSSATWKTVDEALDISDAEKKSESQSESRTKAKKANLSIKQLVVFLPVDLIDIVEKVPAVRSEVVHLLEKVFKWKLAARSDRNVTLLCSSARSASMSFKVTDEKVNESLVLTRISSISELKDPQMAKTAHTKSKPKSVAGVSKAVATMKGYFSKRFTYQSTPLPSGSTSSSSVGTLCRSYARYMFLSDYRRGFLNESLLYFPSRSLPKILVGPVVGRVIRVEREAPVIDASEDMEIAVSFSVPILIEANSPARLTCVVVDSMANTETRTVLEIRGDEPSVFCIQGLVPLRRYVYFFEGVSNGESRRGCFHTPPAETNSLNLVAISSNFPTHMDEEQDSLWAPLLERAKLPWCGLDAILHLGGQVPLHEAAIECVEWASRELSREVLHGNPRDVDKKRVEHVRTRVRRRFQEEYHICWNLPNIRELLAHCSQWFLQSKADIAPFYGRECPGPVEVSRAASLVVSVAKEVVRAYQIQLITAVEGAHPTEKPALQSAVQLHQQDAKPIHDTSSTSTAEPATMSAVIPEPTLSQPNEGEPVSVDNEQDVNADDSGESAADEIVDSGGAVYWQHEDIAVFMCDMRSVSTASDMGEAEPITCNARLSRPLSLQENPVMSEQQWKCFENVLRKKRTQLLVLCMELPLILTNTEHVEKLRDELRPGQAHEVPWKQYDHNHILQHWVACKRQLEQLLLLLFKWKAKRSGRDVLILSGGMRIGIDTMIQDRETKLSIRNFTVGPVTANVETFEFPLSGIACATFGGGIKDDQFTFRHSLLAKKNYLLLRLSIEQPVDEGAKQGKSKMPETKSSNVAADFVPNEPAALSRLHAVDKFQRFPLWWTTYVPMGKAVFWDDTITLKSETDERMLVLRDYVWHDRGFSGALEVFYEKYQFAETARMEDLRSRHSQHVDLRASFMGVLGDLWRAIPESKRQQMAYFLDPFVLEILMSHVAPDLFNKRLTSGEPIELAFFSRVIRDFVFAACLLRLTIITLQEDEAKARQAAVEKRKRDAELAAQEKERAEQAAQQEAARMAELLRTDPLQYAKIKLAEEEAEKQEKLARHQEKLERKKAERLAELEEEQAIAKEQKKLNKLAERDAVEYERRQQALDARIRKLEEKRAQRAAQKKAAAERVQQEQASAEQ